MTRRRRAPCPTGIGDRTAGGDTFVCPATVGRHAGRLDGQRVHAERRRHGASLATTGVGGYLDNAVVTTSGGSTTYDFEATPGNKDACKQGGFAAYGFANQGQCVARVNALG